MDIICHGSEEQRGLLQQERKEVEGLPDNEMKEQYKETEGKHMKSSTIPFLSPSLFQRPCCITLQVFESLDY